MFGRATACPRNTLQARSGAPKSCISMRLGEDEFPRIVALGYPADTAEVLSPIGHIENEAQARELATLAREDPEEARAVYEAGKAERGEKRTETT